MPYIYGINPIKELLKTNKTVNKIYFSESSKEIYEIIKEAKDKKIIVSKSERFKLDKMITEKGKKTKNSQGIVASITDYEYFEVEDIIKYAESKNESPVIVILDKIEDPHNLGAIIRSVDCLGAHGVIIPKRNACPINDTVMKVSAGATSFVKVARVTNLSQTIEKLKESNFWIYGLDMDGESDLCNTKLDGNLGIVIGSEGYGMSQKIKEKCDVIINIPMSGNVNSLNASVSASISLYEILRQKTVK